MSFKIWGKDGVLNTDELMDRLKQWGIADAFSLSELQRRGSVSIGRTRIFVLK